MYKLWHWLSSTRIHIKVWQRQNLTGFCLFVCFLFVCFWCGPIFSSQYFFCLIFFFFLVLGHKVYEILASQPWILCIESWSLNHWTIKKVLELDCFKVLLFSMFFCLSFYGSLHFWQTTLISNLITSTTYCALSSTWLKLFLEFLFSGSSLSSDL